MASINPGKLIAAGFAAGLVINVVESVANLSFLAGPMENVLAVMAYTLVLVATTD